MLSNLLIKPTEFNTRELKVPVTLFYLILWGIICGKIIVGYSVNISLLLLAPLAILCLWVYLKVSTLLYLLLLLGPYDLPYPHLYFAGTTLGIMNIVKSFGLDALIISKTVGTNWKKSFNSDLPAKIYGIFLIISFFSIIVSPSKSNGFKIWLQLLHPYLIYLIISSFLRNRNTICKIPDILILAALFSVMLSVAQILSGRGFVVEDVLRLSISGLSKNAYATFLVVIILLCYSFYIFLKRVKFLYFSALLSGMLVLTGTRIAMISLIILLILMHWLSRKRIKGLIVAIALLLIIWNLPSSINRVTYSKLGLFATMTRIMQGAPIEKYLNTGNIQGRLSFWNVGWDIFLRRPLIGNGFGATAVITKVQGDYSYTTSMGSVTRVHNEWIRVLADVGVLGFFLLIWSLFLFAKRALNIYKQTKIQFTKAVSLAAFLSLLGYIIIGFTESVSTFYFQLGAPVWTLLACSKSLFEREREDTESQLRFDYNGHTA